MTKKPGRKTKTLVSIFAIVSLMTSQPAHTRGYESVYTNSYFFEGCGGVSGDSVFQAGRKYSRSQCLDHYQGADRCGIQANWMRQQLYERRSDPDVQAQYEYCRSKWQNDLNACRSLARSEAANCAQLAR